MRVLVLGGTVFLSRAVAAQAVARGHDVVCATRGVTGSVPEGARHVRWDRSDDSSEVPPTLAGLEPDAVVDVARLPSQVRRAVAAWPAAHWTFVSTINVYADDGSLVEPVHHDVDLATTPEAYGPMKVACEQAVRDGAVASLVVRPGLIAGPGDPSGRFSYWAERLDRAAPGEEVLAPGDPADVVQVVDVRDLADWVVDSLEHGRTGVLDGVGPATPIGHLLAGIADGVAATPRWTWVGQELLADQDVAPWMGERSLPLWLPRPEHDAMMRRPTEPATAAGLVTRPVALTARDTAAWLRATPDAVRTGLTADQEAEVLRAWHAAH